MIRGEKLDGLVLKKVSIGEADLLVTWYTREWGKIRTTVAGALKPKSRLAFGLLPFAENTLRVAGRREGLSFKLIGVSSGSPVLDQTDEVKNTLGFWLLEVVLKSTVDHQPNFFLYDSLWDFFQILGDKRFTHVDADLWRVLCLSRILEVLGWSLLAAGPDRLGPSPGATMSAGFMQWMRTAAGGGVVADDFYMSKDQRQAATQELPAMEQQFCSLLDRSIKADAAVNAIIKSYQ